MFSLIAAGMGAMVALTDASSLVAAEVIRAGDGVTVANAELQEGDGPALGEVLKLVPSHVDPTFNLHDCLVAYRNGMVAEIWRIAARGLSR